MDPDQGQPAASSRPPLEDPAGEPWLAPGWRATSVEAESAGEYEAGAAPAFTVGALLSDTFARYGADPIRLVGLGLIPALLGLFLGLIGASLSRTGSAVGPAALLSLLATVVSLLGTAVMLALLEGGPRAPIGVVAGHGLRRVGWLFLTILAFIAIFLVVFLVGGIPVALVIAAVPPIGFILALVGFGVLVWVSVRLYLALPAVVADDLNTGQAISLSWRVTRPTGVWGRIIVASLVLGLLIVPATLGASLLTVFVPGALALVVSAVVLSLTTPFTALITYSAYRRLVPPARSSGAATDATSLAAAPTPASPAQPDATAPAAAIPAKPDAAVPDAASAATVSAPSAEADASAGPTGQAPLVSWAAQSAPLPAPAPDAPAGRPALTVPPFGRAARSILAIMVGAAVVGVVGIPLGVGRLIAGQITGPGTVGNVAPGTIAFGRSATLSTCTIEGRFTGVSGTESFVWIAAPSRPVTMADQVSIRISVDGIPIVDVEEDRAAFACIGNDVSESVDPGLYVFELVVNGQVSAAGTLIAE